MPFLGVITPKKGKEKSPPPSRCALPKGSEDGGRGVGNESAPELKCTPWKLDTYSNPPNGIIIYQYTLYW